MRWQDLPIVGGSYRDDTRPWSVQDTINMIPVAAEKSGTRSPSILRCAPGFRLFSSGAQNAPCRGLHNVEGTLFGVVGGSLYTWGIDGTATSLASIPGVERVSMAHNQVAGGNQLVIAANNAGYVWDTSKSTFQQITDPGFPGSIAFAFMDGHIIGIDPSRNFAFSSAVADATSYNTLDRMQAEAQPDKLVGLLATHEQLWLFGERTVQPFSDTGAAQSPFQSDSNMAMEIGCASGQTIMAMDNSVFWLGNDGIVYRANGYQPTRISTHAIEQAVSRCDRTRAFAFTYEDRGHKIYYLTFNDGETWGYDAASGEWHRRQSYGLDRWRVSDMVYWNGQWVAADYVNGKLYVLDWDIQAEDGNPLERRRILSVIADSQNPVIVNGFQVVADVGEAQETIPTSISGHLPSGHFGDAVSYRYQVIAQTRPAPVLVSAGALPAGVAMDTNANLSGEFAAVGSYAWTAQVTDGDGNTAHVNDSATVSLQTKNIWTLLGTSNNTTVDFGLDPSAWPLSRQLSSNFNVVQTSPAWDGTVLALPTSTPANSVAIIPVQDAGTGTIVSASVTSVGIPVGRVYGFPSLLITSHGGASYAYSQDHGTTWATVAGPSGLYLSGIARMASGRWIALFQSGATQQLRYSDQAVPTAWTLALGSIAGAANQDIATDGTTGVLVNNVGNSYTTTDGASWVMHSTFMPSWIAYTTGVLRSPSVGIFVAFGAQGTPKIARSTDGGITWAAATFSAASGNILSVSRGPSGYVATLDSGNPPYMSSDLGATWTALAAAPLNSPIVGYMGDP